MRFALVFTLVIMMLSAHVHAADISVFKRDLYDRITIENVNDGTILTKGDKIIIPYSSQLPLKNISKIKNEARTILSVEANGKLLSIDLNDIVTDTRHFRIGSKIILDIFYDSEKLLAKKITGKKKTQPVKEVKDEPKVVKKEVKTSKTIKPVIEEKAPQLKVESTQSPLVDETIVSVSSTVPFGLNVFKRAGRLFIVTDQSDIAIPPQISGYGLSAGWDMREFDVSGGRAWVIDIPDGAYIRPEGRGLVWRLIISDINPNLRSADIRRRFIDPMNPMVDIMMRGTAKLMKVTDPDYGDNLAVVTVNRSRSRMTMPYDFVDFDIIPAVVGTVIKPKRDGVRIQSNDSYLTVSNVNKLAVSIDDQGDIVRSYLTQVGQDLIDAEPLKTALDRVYYFPNWGASMSPPEYFERRKELDSFLAMAQKDDKLAIILDLIKLSLSQGMGHEALGYLKLAGDVNSQIVQTSEYQALRGAAHFLASQYDLAEKYFSSDDLQNISETKLWLAASQAALGKEEEALKTYMDNGALAAIYPYAIRRMVLSPLALVSLNQDKLDKANLFIDLLSDGYKDLSPEEEATIAYLKGRLLQSSGRPDEAVSSLYKASKGSKLGPYGIRSELLLIQDEVAREAIDFPEAIQRMERLRFAWRGDSLEPKIYNDLGALYIDNGEPRKGLGVLKRAATNAEDVKDRRAVVRKMADAYKSIFVGEKFDETDPLITVAVYDEFKELTPVGEVGNQLIDRLADKLMSINMMSRATEVLKDKMDRLGQGQHAINTGIRIAKIQLLDREPEEALKTIKTIDSMITKYKGDDKDEMNSTVVLLKARAHADTGNAEKALFMTEGLDDTDDVIRLRVDTAWKTGNWVAVTDNLSKLLVRENMTLSTPPTNEQTQLILNQAVALSLSNQYDALQRFAAEYDLLMKQTPVYKTFLVVTRPQNISNLADRKTLLDVASEVDLFQGVLEQNVE